MDLGSVVGIIHIDIYYRTGSFRAIQNDFFDSTRDVQSTSCSPECNGISLKTADKKGAVTWKRVSEITLSSSALQRLRLQDDLSSPGCSITIRPLDKYIIYLTSNVTKRENYINAIAVPSFTKENAFIITHYPAPENAVDFLRLITDYDCELVVSMEPLQEVESVRLLN